MTPDAPGSQELSRRLVARQERQIAASGLAAPERAAAGARAACEEAMRSLSRWLGANGAAALFARARAQAQARHPVLADIGLGDRIDSELSGVDESVRSHGPAAVRAGLEALLTALVDLLGRLIGADMAARLVDPDGPIHASNDESQR